LDRSVLSLDQAQLLGEAIVEPEGHLIQLLCTVTLLLFGIQLTKNNAESMLASRLNLLCRE